jgi:adenylate cyclase
VSHPKPSECGLSTTGPNAYPCRVVKNAAQKRSRKRLLELACICLAVAQIGWFVFPQMDVVRDSEWVARDKMVAMDLRPEHTHDVVFLAIDERTITLDHLFPEDVQESPILETMLKGFPWPRSVYAQALDRLFAAGAKIVVLDLIFDKPRDGDEVFKAALDRHADKVILGANFSVAPGNPETPDDDMPSLTMPAESLIPGAESDPRVGYVNFWTDEGTNVVRTAIYSTTVAETLGRPPHPRERVFNSLSHATLSALGVSLPADRQRRPLPFHIADQKRIATFPLGALFVPYEWKQILKNGEVFRDKIVVVGPSATRLQDFHVTVSGEKIPGPMLHIHALLAAWNDAFYTRSGPIARAILVFLAALAALAITWPLRRKPVAAFSLLFGGALGYLGLTYALMMWAEYLLHPIQPSLALLLAGMACIAWNFAQERRDSGRMRSTLERYVSRNVVREILDNRDDFLAALGGSRRPMTVFFSDVRGFTSFVEREDEHAVVRQLNEYLGRMVAIIFRHQGTVDKFMGDGIMAVWGNVVSEGATRDAINAVNAALEMLEELPRLNQTWTERGLSPFAIGIGLHHGEAVFGNIGSAEKMEPTVIGDTVNLASRVEGLTKKYGVTLCITQPLAELVADVFPLRSVDLVQVVGKSRPVEIFTIVGKRDVEMPAWIKCYEGAIADFRARRFAEAAAAFKLCLEDQPADKLSAIYLARSEAFFETPPPDDWIGTEIATSK